MPTEPRTHIGMTMIKKLIGAVAFTLACTAAYASEGGYPLDAAPNRVNDVAALQNGAKLFVNYCLNCHSASAMRYNKMQDIRSEEHTSELQSLMRISYAVFCLQKKKDI